MWVKRSFACVWMLKMGKTVAYSNWLPKRECFQHKSMTEKWPATLCWKWPERSNRRYNRQQRLGYPEQGGWLWRTAGVATRCAPMVQWFNQQPLKRLKFLKLAQNQNRHQKRIPQVKTNQMSGQTSELQSCFMFITTSDSGCLPPFQWQPHLVNLCDLQGWPLQMG